MPDEKTIQGERTPQNIQGSDCHGDTLLEEEGDYEEQWQPEDDYAAPRQHGGFVAGIVIGVVACVALFAVGAVLWGIFTTPAADMSPSANTRGNESAETWARIMEPAVSDDEYGVLCQMKESMSRAVEDLPHAMPGFDPSQTYINQAALGTWPGEDEGWGTPETCPQNPQLWVRLAMLSRDWLHERLGGDWYVVDFSYPIDGENERGYTVTRLAGMSDDVIGMCIDVEYHRWEETPRFACAQGSEAKATEAHLRYVELNRAIGAYAQELGHEMLLQGGDVPVILVNPDRPSGYDAEEYEAVQKKDRMTEIAKRLASILKESGYEQGEMRMAPLVTDVPISGTRLALSATLSWKYGFLPDEAVSFLLQGLKEEYSQREARACLASGVYRYDAQGEAQASWGGDGNITVQEAPPIDPIGDDSAAE